MAASNARAAGHLSLLAGVASPALAVHHAINAAEAERGGRYRTTHLTARVTQLLDEAGWLRDAPDRLAAGVASLNDETGRRDAAR